MFQVMTGDDWSLVLYSTMEVLQRQHGAAGLIVGSAFITIFYVFATFVVNNLFIAVILESFDLQATQRDANRPSTWLRFTRRWVRKTYTGLMRRRMAKVEDEADWLLTPAANTESKGSKPAKHKAPRGSAQTAGSWRAMRCCGERASDAGCADARRHRRARGAHHPHGGLGGALASASPLPGRVRH
eukprot:3935711-Rhodomonas_salina.3